MPNKAPLSGKFYGAGLGGSAAFALTWILTTFIPAFHNGLPTNLANFLPGFLGVIGALIGAHQARHRITPSDLLSAVTELEQSYNAIHPLISNSYVSSPPPPISSDPPLASEPTPPELQDLPRGTGVVNVTYTTGQNQ